MQSQSRGILQQGHRSRAGMQLQLRFSCWTQMSWSSLHPLPSQGFHSKNFSLRTIKSIPKMSFRSCPISACWTQISQLSSPPKSGFSYPKESLGNGIPEVSHRELLPTAPHPKEYLGLSLLKEGREELSGLELNYSPDFLLIAVS